MKKIKLLLLIVFIQFSILNAQTERGNFLFDGGLGIDLSIQGLAGINNDIIDSDVYGNGKSKISVSMLGGYFLTDVICLGIQGAYESSANSERFYDITTTSASEMYMLYPVLRTYFGDNYWAQLKYGFGSSNTTSTTDDLITITTLSTETPLTDLSLTFGYAIYINNLISLNPNFGYEIKTKTSRMVDVLGNQFNITETWGGLAFGFTIAVHLDNFYYHFY